VNRADYSRVDTVYRELFLSSSYDNLKSGAYGWFKVD